MDWKLIDKNIILGDTKEYFAAKKDILRFWIYIIYQCKKGKTDPMIEILEQISHAWDDKKMITLSS